MLYIQAARVLVLAAALFDVASSVSVFLTYTSQDGSMNHTACSDDIIHEEFTDGQLRSVSSVASYIAEHCSKHGYGDNVVFENSFDFVELPPERRVEESEGGVERKLQGPFCQEQYNCFDDQYGCFSPGQCIVCCGANSNCIACMGGCGCSQRRLDDGGFKDKMEEARMLQNNVDKQTSIDAQCLGDFKYFAKVLKQDFGNMCLGEWSKLKVVSRLSN